MRRVRLLLWIYPALALLAWLLLRAGAYIADDTALTLHSTNAFLFLLGLGSFMWLLSPPPAARRLRQPPARELWHPGMPAGKTHRAA